MSPVNLEGFKPTTVNLARILNTISRERSVAKTNISHLANLNYSRALRHIMWLEQKGFVKSNIIGSKIHFTLTENGNDFAKVLER